MASSYTYLLILFFTVIVCFIASFDRRIRFYRYFCTFLLSCTVVAVPFIAWDICFTKLGIWSFNPDYTLGLIIAGLPLEEWLFFYCIPFACIFTYFCLEQLIRWNGAPAFNNVIVFISIIVCVVVALLHYQRIYTFITSLITIVTLAYLHFIAKKEWITRASLTYLILMLGFFPVNGILTGTGLEAPIVNYNPNELLGVRIGTIPVEDAVYGYSQFLLNVYFFKFFQIKTYNYEKSKERPTHFCRACTRIIEFLRLNTEKS